MNSRVRSYYCPSGATITPTWISSKCVLRSTYSLTNFRQNHETSPDIKLYSRVDGDGVGYVSVSGTFGGRGFGEQRLGDFGTPD